MPRERPREIPEDIWELFNGLPMEPSDDWGEERACYRPGWDSVRELVA